MYYNNTTQKKAGVAILISDTANFRAKKIIRDKERHYTILQEDVMVLNLCAPNNSVKIHEAKPDRIARRNR